MKFICKKNIPGALGSHQCKSREETIYAALPLNIKKLFP